MAVTVTIDKGNTVAKAMVWHGETPASDVVYGRLTVADVERLSAEEPNGFDAGILCTVCGDKTGLAEALATRCKRSIVLTPDTPLPIDISEYRSHATLGADRIAALVGARELYPDTDVLVVDYGTAITYDLLESSGRFVGGNIAPGIKMRLRALHEFTAQLPEVETAGECPVLGIDTATAMRSGAIFGVVSELEGYAKRNPRAKVIVTGGTYTKIQELINLPVAYEPNLVLYGLNCILRYNEDK